MGFIMVINTLLKVFETLQVAFGSLFIKERALCACRDMLLESLSKISRIIDTC